MDFRFTPEEETFRQELRQFLSSVVTPDLKTETGFEWHADGFKKGPHSKEFNRMMGQKGYFGVSWPKEYGGQGMSMVYQFLLVEELVRANAPTPGLTLTSIGPTLMKVGSDEQKNYFLPRILSGEIEIALGYTEPGAGSDLASLQIRAVEDGDDFVINGQKMFTSGAHHCEYIWLLARTDPNVPKHKGISLLLVPVNSPGLTVRPLWTISDGRTNETFYENVRVPRTALVGEKNRGWYYAAMALDYERVGVAPYSRYLSVWQTLVDFCKNTAWNGRPLSEDPIVRQQLAQMGVEVEIARVFAYRTAWMIDKGIVPNYEASAQKVFATELLQRIANAATQIFGLYGQLQPEDRYAPVGGNYERLFRSSRNRTVGGGSSQMQRNVIANRGLGLPRG